MKGFMKMIKVSISSQITLHNGISLRSNLMVSLTIVASSEWCIKKAVIFNDLEAAELILKNEDPKEQKALGRLVKNFDATVWDKVADEVVYSANLAKFSQNKDLKEKLLATGDKLIVECSPYDKIWGNGMSITETLSTPEEEWKETNRLGKAIMRVRTTLREE